MDPKELFARALNQASQVVNHVDQTDFDKPTPDTEWNVRQLVGHMLYELSWAADLVRGATIAQVGDRYNSDLIGHDLTLAWRVAADEAKRAVALCNLKAVAHLSYGDVKVAVYLQEVASDLVIHAWDLGVAIGVDVHLDSAVAQAVYDRVLPRASSLQESGLFAPPLKVAESADLQTKLLALFGRDAGWKKP